MSVEKLLDDLIAYPQREFRVVFREYLQLKQSDEMERRNSASCISRATLIDAATMTYSFEDAELKHRPEERVAIIDLKTEESFQSTIKTLNTGKREVSFEKMKSVPLAISVLMAPFNPPKSIPESIQQVKERLASLPVLQKILARDPALGEPASLQRVGTLDGSFLIIQGPPGTGKTYTGTRLVSKLIEAGYRIGIMAPSHKALNQFCKKLGETGVMFQGAKAYSKERDKIESPSFENVRSSEVAKRFMNWQVVGCTSFQFAAMPDACFDYLVIDEAGQISLCHAIAAARAAKNVLLLGDQQQLSQVSQAKHPEGAGGSILEYLLGESAVVPPHLGVFLSESYRMNAEITEFISQLCYNGKLKSHPSAASQRFALSSSPEHPLGPSGVVFLPVNHTGNEQMSVEEAVVVKELVTKIKTHSPETSVIVVAPFRAHENLIRDHVKDQCLVGTVDRFQGAEADVVIYTMATSDPESMPRDAEFLLSLNRMNVAISRAKKKAILICSPKLLETPPDTVEKMRLASALCFVKAYAHRLKFQHTFEYVVLDIETTGLNPNQANVIEIAGVKCRGQEIIESFSEIVKPAVLVDPSAFKAHGLSDEFLAQNGRDPKIVLQEFLHFMGELPLVAHNGIGFDFPFLSNELARHGLAPMKNDLLDTLPLARRFLKTEDGSFRLQALCDAYGIINEQAHRALSDAKATATLFMRMLRDESLPVADDLWSLSYGFTFDTILSLPDGMDLLREAMAANVDLEIEYDSPGKGPRARWVRPIGLAISHGGWRSLKALCLEENIDKHFRLDRITKLIKTRT